MNCLDVQTGSSARAVLCDAFGHAAKTIDAEFFSLTDTQVIESLNQAAERHIRVRVHIEAHPDRYRKHSGSEPSEKRGSWAADSLRRRLSKQIEVVPDNDPAELLHAKAAVVDRETAYFATANPTARGFSCPGEILVADSEPSDVAAVERSIEHKPLCSARYAVTGPSPALRSSIESLLRSPSDLRVASEDFSDRHIVDNLIARRAQGRHDRVLLQGYKESTAEKQAVARLEHAGVDVRFLQHSLMHEKYVDAGRSFYVGSANLTRNGLDESREVGIVAPASAARQAVARLRAEFEGMWAQAS